MVEVNYEVLALQFKKLLDNANIQLANEMARNDEIKQVANEYKELASNLQNELNEANDKVNKYVLHYGEIVEEV